MSDKLIFKTLDVKRLIIQTRIAKKLTLRSLAAQTQYSYQTLSKFENGKLDLHMDSLNILMLSLDIDLQTIQDVEKHLDQYLNLAFGYLACDASQDLMPLIDSLTRFKPYIDYTGSAQKYRILFYMLHVLRVHEDEENFRFIEATYMNLEADYKQLFHEYQSIHFLNHGKLTESIEAINKALSFGSRDFFAGMVHYHASIIHTYYGKVLQALRHAEKAESEFIKSRNFKRLFSIQANIATIQSKLGHFSSAKQDYLKLLDTQIDDELKTMILYNLSWFEYREGHYSVSLGYIARIEEDQALTENGLFIKTACLFGLGEGRHAESYINEKMEHIKDPMFKCEIEILRLENSGTSDSDLEHQLLKLFELTQDSRNTENVEFALDKLISFYNAHYKYKKSVRFYEEKIKLRNWMFS